MPGMTPPLPASLAGLLAVFGPLFYRPVAPDLPRHGLRPTSEEISTIRLAWEDLAA